MALIRIFLTALVITMCACASAPGKNSQQIIDLKKQATTLYDAKNYDGAIKSYVKLVELWPEEADNWFRLGNCYARSKQPNKAVLAYRETLVRDPKHSKAWFNMAYVQAGMLGKTVAEMYQHIDPKDPEFEAIKQLTEAVITPFGLDNDEQ